MAYYHQPPEDHRDTKSYPCSLIYVLGRMKQDEIRLAWSEHHSTQHFNLHQRMI